MKEAGVQSLRFGFQSDGVGSESNEAGLSWSVLRLLQLPLQGEQEAVLWLCHTQLGMGLKDIKQMILSGFKSAFMPFHVKQQYLRKVSEELAAFADDEPLAAHRPTSSVLS